MPRQASTAARPQPVAHKPEQLRGEAGRGTKLFIFILCLCGLVVISYFTFRFNFHRLAARSGPASPFTMFREGLENVNLPVDSLRFDNPPQSTASTP